MPALSYRHCSDGACWGSEVALEPVRGVGQHEKAARFWLASSRGFWGFAGRWSSGRAKLHIQKWADRAASLETAFGKNFSNRSMGVTINEHTAATPSLSYLPILPAPWLGLHHAEVSAALEVPMGTVRAVIS